MNRLKQNRAASFVAVTLVYIIATVVGVLAYRALTLDWWLSILIADVAATMATFIFSLIFRNASVYDPYWSVQPPVILVAFAVGKELTLLGVLLLVVVSFWAIRLTANWAYTFGNLTHQDWRYTMLHEKTGVFYPIINFVGIHMVPTLVVYGCVLPGVYAIREGLSANIASVLFLCLSLCAVVMQGIADIQMHKFRKNRNAPFIRIGLWKYSRHPNYLGEILMWGAWVCPYFARHRAHGISWRELWQIRYCSLRSAFPWQTSASPARMALRNTKSRRECCCPSKNNYLHKKKVRLCFGLLPLYFPLCLQG